MVVEHDYVDRDYLDDHASYYDRCFTDYGKCCRRLHFFTFQFDHDEFGRIVRNEVGSTSLRRFSQAYQGFIVARPLPSAIVGRTVLRTYPRANGRRNYPCVVNYDVSLYGIPLMVNSLAFQEQDTVLAACATVALWCAFHKTADLFNMTAPAPAKITAAASDRGHLGRPFPSRGLTIQEMCDAVRWAGLEPELIQVRPKIDLPSVLYSYLHMGIPVLMGVQVGSDYHAITLTGFSLPTGRIGAPASSPSPNPVRFVAQQIDEFYAHDDQIGPFARVKVVRSSADESVKFHGAWKEPLEPFAIIVPVYHKIRLAFADLQQWLVRLDRALGLLLSPVMPRCWDVHLTTVQAWKAQLRVESKVDPAQRERLLLAGCPRFLWRAILQVNGDAVVEVLADATDLERSMPIHDVVWYDEALKGAVHQVLVNASYQAMFKRLLTDRLWSKLEASSQ